MQERVTVNGTEVILVGTAHVSQESAQEVEDVIAAEDPDVVCVELDENRYESLTEEEQWKNLEVKEALEDGKGHLLLMNVLLSIYQQRIGDALDITPGSEMLAAITAAEERNVPVNLIDRDINDTIRDALNGLSWREKFKLLVYGVEGFIRDTEITEDEIEELKEANIVDTLVTELGDTFPSLSENFLDKRNAYMAEQIKDIEADTVVAVVGAAHVTGIKEYLEQDSVPAVSAAPSRRISVTALLQYGVPALILGMFAYLFLFVGFAAAKDAFLFWAVINSVLAGIAAIIARAHPVTIGTSMLVAPFASINPGVPTGLIAAYIENRFRPPKVGDLESIGSVTSYGAFWHNSALRLLLVFFLVNLGSATASYIGAGYLANVLAGA